MKIYGLVKWLIQQWQKSAGKPEDLMSNSSGLNKQEKMDSMCLSWNVPFPKISKQIFL